jgi:gas vesicle protein
MPESIFVALIGGLCGVISAIIAAIMAANKTATEMRVNQAVTNTKIDGLTDEVQKHNNFAQRMPVLEEQLKNIDVRLKTVEQKVG